MVSPEKDLFLTHYILYYEKTIVKKHNPYQKTTIMSISNYGNEFKDRQEKRYSEEQLLQMSSLLVSNLFTVLNISLWHQERP